MTMSISRAPSLTEASISRSLRSCGISPAGKPVEKTCSHRNAGAIEGFGGGGHKTMIDADRAGVDGALSEAQRIENVGAHRRLRLGAEALHASPSYRRH